MTEHAAVVFVFFFLAEYSSIALMCLLITILFLGGYLIFDITDFLIYLEDGILNNLDFYEPRRLGHIFEVIRNSTLLSGLTYGFNIGLKTSILIFTFI